MSGSSGAVGRILVVEDDLVTARFMAHVLGRRGGFEVRHAPDPRMALAMAESQSWDLVITDVEMPNMTGLELLAALRRISPDIPVAVMTGHASVDYAVQAIRSHAHEFLEKPVHPDQLIATALPDHIGFREVAMVRYLDERFIDLSDVQKVAA